MAKRTGKADMAKENAPVKMPNRRFIQKTKRHGFCLDSHILKREREGKEKMGRGKRKEKVSLYGPLVSVYTDSIENA